MAKQKFRTNANGNAFPITPKKGGALAVAAVVLGGTLAFTTAGTGSVDLVAGQNLKAKSNSSKAETTTSHYGQSFSRIALKQLKQKTIRAVECAQHSFDQVHQFFLQTPCHQLDRLLLAMADEKSNTVVVSVAWVRMYSADAARRLKNLIDADGTGSITPRVAALLNMADVRFTGKYYASDQKKQLVVIAEATSGGGNPSGDTMKTAAQIAILLPPP